MNREETLNESNDIKNENEKFLFLPQEDKEENSNKKVEINKKSYLDDINFYYSKIVDTFLKSKIKLKIVLMILVLVFAIIYFNVKYNYLLLENITTKENFTTQREAVRKGKQYLNDCLEGKLLNKEKFEISKNPKVTMIIPLYNTGELIKYVLRSIQNQNMEDIEIILVNDFSNDNGKTLNIIEKLRETDQRIVIINNKKNMGILYSRSIAILQSKGEYIMNLDHDDFIFDEDVFDTAYKAAKNGDFDIISLMHCNIKEYHYNKDEISLDSYHIPNNFEVYQPKLSVYTMFNNDGEFTYFDYTIWAKLFKADVYKKTINILTYERYSKFVTYTEDILGLFAVCSVAESYKFIRKYAVFHKDYVTSTSYTAPNDLRIFADTFFSEIIFDFARNEYKKLSAQFLVKRTFLSSEENNKYLLKVIHKIMNCEYIEEKYKEKIRAKFGDFIK